LPPRPRSRVVLQDDRRQRPACRDAACPPEEGAKPRLGSGEAVRARCLQPMAGDSPDRYLINMSKAKRMEKDIPRLSPKRQFSTAVAPLSPRGCPHAPVSMPITWAQVKHGLDPMQFTILTVPSFSRSRRHGPIIATRNAHRSKLWLGSEDKAKRSAQPDRFAASKCRGSPIALPGSNRHQSNTRFSDLFLEASGPLWPIPTVRRSRGDMPWRLNKVENGTYRASGD
jgi:hypothetical protein